MKITYQLYPNSRVIRFVTDWNIGSFPALPLIIEQLSGVESVKIGHWQRHKYHLFVTIKTHRNLEVMAKLIQQKIDEFFAE